MSVQDALVIVNGVSKYTNNKGEAEFEVNPGSHVYTINKDGLMKLKGEVVVLEDKALEILMKKEVLEMTIEEFRKELIKLSTYDFYLKIVITNIKKYGIGKWFLTLPHGEEFWAIPGAPVTYNYKMFLNELMDHIGRKNEPDWILRKLNLGD